MSSPSMILEDLRSRVRARTHKTPPEAGPSAKTQHTGLLAVHDYESALVVLLFFWSSLFQVSIQFCLRAPQS